jgi:hypothetical protein
MDPEASFGDVLDGVAVDMTDHRQEKWCQVFLPALHAFHSLYGHSNVPEDFVVPMASPAWPRATWGLKLGQSISRSSDVERLYKAQVEASQTELHKLGFTWTTTTAADRAWASQVLPTLRVFHQERGHCNVKSTFVVPERLPWPRETWGLNLGAIVKRIRAGRSYAAQVARDSDALLNLNFLWDSLDVEWQERVLPALVTFADEFGDTEPLEASFVVPSNAPWPKPTWGLALGAFLSDSQRREHFYVQILRDAHVLDELGFAVRLSEETWERHVVPLLTIFSTLFPDRHELPEAFVIPHNPPWPRKVWGLELGKVGTQNAARMAVVTSEWKQSREAPQTSSLASENRSRQWKTRLFPALVAFVEMFGDCRLGGQFTVPSQAPWPKPTWGLRLGAEIAAYVKSGAYFEQIGRDADRLDVLGVSFKLSRAPWEQHAACLLATFSTLYPCTVVPDTFVVPAEDPWSETTWGVKLGKLVAWNAQQMTAIENEWRMQVLTAVEVFQREMGATSIGKAFVVPCRPPWPAMTWGRDLARILHRLHVGECYDGHAALAQSSTNRLQLSLQRRRDETWETIFTALKLFSKRFGHCNVQPQFVVPANASWPPATWNLQLGQLLDKMKATGSYFSDVGRWASHLSKLAFTLALSKAAWAEKVAPLIATFATLRPRDAIPGGFTIPSEEPWPEHVWGVDLGVIVQWNSSRVETVERDWRDQVLEAYEVFQHEHGSNILRDEFVVPSRPPWPSTTWGRALRQILTCVQVGQHYGGHLALANFQSAEACAVSSGRNDAWKTLVFPALHTFARVFGHCAVPEAFVVPAESPWPEPAFGVELGRLAEEMETRGRYFAEVGLNADRLETFGFRYKLADAPWREHVAPLLSTFAAQSPHEILPEEFTVPATASWPRERWGLKLGKLVAWSCRYAWNREETRWKAREMPVNTTLAGAFGYCRVAASFRAPSEAPWPKQMWGLRMKTFVREMHRSGALFVRHGLSHAVTSDQAFGFVFSLSAEVSGGEPEREEYKAQVERLGQQDEPARPLGKRPLPDVYCRRQEGWVGSYSPEARKARVQRFLNKRQERVWLREVKYGVRKSFADARLRVKGRFVRKEDEKALRELLALT